MAVWRARRWLLTDARGERRYRVPSPVMLMLIAAAQRYPTAHQSADGVGIAPSTRLTVYGITPEIYGAHNGVMT